MQRPAWSVDGSIFASENRNSFGTIVRKAANGRFFVALRPIGPAGHSADRVCEIGVRLPSVRVGILLQVAFQQAGDSVVVDPRCVENRIFAECFVPERQFDPVNDGVELLV